MINTNEESNAQSWELEVTCKNKKYLDAVVKAILKYGLIEFEVNIVEFFANQDDCEGRYTVLMWSCWFHNLKMISKDLAKIEKELDEID